MIKLVAKPRRQGKTQAAIDWVLAGQRVDGYPGWSRVLLVHNVQEALRLRGEYNLDPKQVYTLHEWQRAHNVNPETEVGIENLDLYLHNLIGHHGVATFATITGEAQS